MQLTLSEAAQLLGLTPRQVRYRVKNGELKATRRNGRWSFDEDDLPMTPSRKRAQAAQAEALQSAVDEALQPHTRKGKRYTVASMKAFTGSPVPGLRGRRGSVPDQGGPGEVDGERYVPARGRDEPVRRVVGGQILVGSVHRRNEPPSEVNMSELSGAVIGAAIEVHRCLGPGLLERVYQDCLAWELGQRGLHVGVERELPIRYKDLTAPGSYRVDLLVEERLIVEVKSVSTILPLHRSQLLTYLRLGGFEEGLLINFNVALLREGIHRISNTASSITTPSNASSRPRARA
ncbi:MAG: GxxExxY protein [Alphaproteobacteria bacterium]|nr:GxxExxY protein [Alphaproteobacteria bacterium]